jgi:hypothetical protein
MKIYISADIEGTAGITVWPEAEKNHADYPEHRQEMTREVWVPYDFVAKEERYRFLLPGAAVVGYREERRPAAPDPMPPGTLVTVQVPFHGAGCEGCTVLGRRLDIRGRQTAAELRDVLSGRLTPALFVEELLVETPPAGTPSPTASAGADPR